MSTSELVKANQLNNSSTKQREDAVINYTGCANWEQMIMPAPVVVGILGTIVAIINGGSQVQDFELPGNLKYIRQRSCRAAMLQIVNQATEAFRQAESGMQVIKLEADNILDDVRKTLEMLYQASPQEVNLILPKNFKRILQSTENCKVRAALVEQTFLDVTLLSAEVQEACVAKQGSNEDQIRENKIMTEVTKENKASAEANIELAKDDYERASKDFDSAKELYEKACDGIPSGWEMIGMNIVSGLAQIILGAAANKLDQPYKQQEAGNKPAAAEAAAAPAAAPGASTGPLLATLSTALDEFAQIDNETKKPDWKKRSDPKSELMYVQRRFEDVRSKTQGNVTANNIIDRALKACEILTNMLKEIKDIPAEDAARIASDVNKVLLDARVFAAEFAAVSSVPPTAGVGPGASTAAHELPDQNGSAAQVAMRDAQYKLNQTRENLNASRINYKASSQILRDSNVKMGELLGQMARLDIEAATLDAVRSYLVRSIEALATLRTQWSKLTSFFTTISNIIQASMDRSIRAYLDEATTARDLKIANIPISTFLQDGIYLQAQSACQVTHVVRLLASTYYDVSTKHLTERLNTLSLLITLPANQIAAEQQKLLDGVKQAQSDILSIANAKKAEYEEMVDNRLQTLKEIQDKVCTPATKKEEEKVKAVADAVGEKRVVPKKPAASFF